MKDRHIMMLTVLAAFFGAMLFISDLASTPAVTDIRNQTVIPDDITEDLDLPSTDIAPYTASTETAIAPESGADTEMERIDTLLEQLSEFDQSLENTEDSRMLIAAVYVN